MKDMTIIEKVVEDLLSAQDVQGTNLLYTLDGNNLVAIDLDEEGDEQARYLVLIHLKQL